MDTLNWVLALVAITFFWGFFSANRIMMQRVNIKIKDWPEESTSILLLSDLHTSGHGFRIRRTIAMAQNTSCDIVCITGDIISRRIEKEKRVANVIGKIANGRPTFLVWGNNDYNPEIDRQYLYELLEEKGVKVLFNERVKHGNLTIGGLGDPFWNKADIEKTLAEDVDLLLSHTPDPIKDVNQRAKLMLAGHTHAGQICWFDGSPLLPELRSEKAFSYGLQRYNKTIIYTTSGIGTTRIPLRFFCYPELVLLEVTPE